MAGVVLVFVARVVVPEAVAVKVTAGVMVLVVEAAVVVTVVVIVNKVSFARDFLLVLVVVVVMVVSAECGDLFFCERSWRSTGLSSDNFFYNNRRASRTDNFYTSTEGA